MQQALNFEGIRPLPCGSMTASERRVRLPEVALRQSPNGRKPSSSKFLESGGWCGNATVQPGKLKGPWGGAPTRIRSNASKALLRCTS